MLDAEKLLPIFRNSIETACQDKPSRESFKIINGEFVFMINGNRDNWAALCQLMGVPSHAKQEIQGEKLISRWPSHADQVFGQTGLLAQRLPGYEMRLAQLHAGRLFQRGIEMGEPVVLEAGTGTGKSLIYLMIARAMNKRVIVSTSNKALQMQLYRKDAPFVASVFPSKITLVQGKGNYACNKRVEDGATMSADLQQWYGTTETGNTQEINFETDWKELQAITVDDSCVGKKMCPCIADCFYYKARAERQDANIIICNHMLLALHQKFPGAQILPEADVIVIDEAHQLASYVSTANGVELKVQSYERHVKTLLDHGIYIEDIDRMVAKLQGEVKGYLVGKSDDQVGINKEDMLRSGVQLAELLMQGADQIWNPNDMPQAPQEKRLSNVAKRIRAAADNLMFASYQTTEGFVRWITKSSNSISSMPYDVSKLVGSMAGFTSHETTIPDYTQCARCGKTLTADTVHLLGNTPYGPTCIQHVDPFGDAEEVSLSEWLAQEHPAPSVTTHKKTAILFTSATLGTPDLAPFMRDHGLPHALQMQVESPFDYKSNSLLYVPDNNAPNTKSPNFLDFMVEQMETMVHSSGGGAFLLFTSNAALRYAVDKLRKPLERAGYPCFVQGEGYSKLEIINQVKAHGNAVLFATKSFFEGVDIQGEALRLVIIDKMPFAAPSPYSNAQHEHIREWARQNLKMSDKDLEWYPFNAKSIPDMIIDLKQGAGRLIRSHRDRGVIAVLDNRLLTTQYGRSKVLPSLPNSPLVRNVSQVQSFFNPPVESTPIKDLTPLELAKQLYAIEL